MKRNTAFTLDQVEGFVSASQKEGTLADGSGTIEKTFEFTEKTVSRCRSSNRRFGHYDTVPLMPEISRPLWSEAWLQSLSSQGKPAKTSLAIGT